MNTLSNTYATNNKNEFSDSWAKWLAFNTSWTHRCFSFKPILSDDNHGCHCKNTIFEESTENQKEHNTLTQTHWCFRSFVQDEHHFPDNRIDNFENSGYCKGILDFRSKHMILARNTDIFRIFQQPTTLPHSLTTFVVFAFHWFLLHMWVFARAFVIRPRRLVLWWIAHVFMIFYNQITLPKNLVSNWNLIRHTMGSLQREILRPPEMCVCPEHTHCFHHKYVHALSKASISTTNFRLPLAMQHFGVPIELYSVLIRFQLEIN
jgi:hypothetical protein